MRTTRERSNTVLFAGVTEGARLIEAGEAGALEALQQCLAQLRAAAESQHGRVIKTVGEELLAVFATPDDAAAAAAQMQHAIHTLPEIGGVRLAVRIGFHAGPVLQDGGDVFGDTVNLAARLAQQANPEQIITSSDTGATLAEHHRRSLRQLYPIEVKGKAEAVELCELVWRVGNDTAQFNAPLSGRPPPIVLRLRYGERQFLRRRENDSLSIGREDDCDVVIRHALVSRHHCLIQRRHDKFVLIDRSSNGTFVTIDGATEFALHREEFILGKHGWISCGQPRAESEHLLEFFCE